MPRVLFFPYFGPSRRSEKRVVEIRLEFSAGEESEFPQQVSDIRSPLIRAGILTQDEIPEQAVAEEKPPGIHPFWRRRRYCYSARPVIG